MHSGVTLKLQQTEALDAPQAQGSRQLVDLDSWPGHSIIEIVLFSYVGMLRTTVTCVVLVARRGLLRIEYGVRKQKDMTEFNHSQE